MRISLKVMDTDLPLLDDRMMDLLAVLSCSLLPICYRTFIQSLGMNNRLDRASIREQDHHDHDQCRWPAQPFHHRASSCTKCLLTRVTTRALGLIRMNTNIGFVVVCICHSMPMDACFFKPSLLFTGEWSRTLHTRMGNFQSNGNYQSRVWYPT